MSSLHRAAPSLLLRLAIAVRNTTKVFPPKNRVIVLATMNTNIIFRTDVSILYWQTDDVCARLYKEDKLIQIIRMAEANSTAMDVDGEAPLPPTFSDTFEVIHDKEVAFYLRSVRSRQIASSTMKMYFYPTQKSCFLLTF